MDDKTAWAHVLSSICISACGRNGFPPPSS